MKENAFHLELFRSLAKGDEKSFEKLYCLYFPRLFAFSFKIINDNGTAKDIVQNVFIKVWETRTTFVFEKPESFLYQMVRNASINYIRHQKVICNLKMNVRNKFLGEELYFMDMVGNEPYILIEKELENKILEVQESLPTKCLTVFKLSRNEGLTNSQIAEKLEISVKAVEKHISKALKIYRHNFADYFPLHIMLLVLGVN